MALNATQQALLADLFETNPEFKLFATQLMLATATEAEDRAQALRSLSEESKPAKTKAVKRPVGSAKRGRPVGSKNKPKLSEDAPKAPSKPKAKAKPVKTVKEKPATKEADETTVKPDWKNRITVALKGKSLLTRELQEEIEKSGLAIAGGTLNTYLYGMKKDGSVVGEGKRGTTRYSLA